MPENNSFDEKTDIDQPTPPLHPPVSPAEPTTETPATVDATNEPTAPQAKKQKNPFAVSVAIVIGIIVLLGVGVGGGMLIQNALKQPSASPSLNPGVDGNTTITQEESSIAAVAEKVNPSVVSIVGTTQSELYYTSSGSAAGTGIIVSTDGYVLTNNHVIQGTSDISIVDSEGNKYTDVTVIGRDPLNDVAFLKIEAKNTTFKAAELGNSSTLRTGQQVVAIGNALGQYSNTVTSGIVSGTGRPVTAASENGETESLTDLIQTDASINPGNSGGPLVNMAGQVIGINTAIVEDANGIGFAIPINATKGILAGVLENGTITRAYLGVNYATITPDVAEEYGLDVKQGAFIYAEGNTNPVASDSPAGKAGLQKGDIITKIGDTTLGQSGSLGSVIGQYRPGDTVTITFLRGNDTRTADVTFTAYSE